MTVTVIIIVVSTLGLIYGMGYRSVRRSWIAADVKAIEESHQDRLERIHDACNCLRQDVHKLNQRMSQVESNLRCLTPLMGEDYGREDP
jgi:hypothetical protein